MYCTYCGCSVDLFCRACGEAHLMTAQEFYAEHGEWPESYEPDPTTDDLKALEAIYEAATGSEPRA